MLGKILSARFGGADEPARQGREPRSSTSPTCIAGRSRCRAGGGQRVAAGREAAAGLLLDRQPRDHQPVLRHRVHDGPPQSFVFGDATEHGDAALRAELLQLRAAAAADLRACGRSACSSAGPGRGKTASAILMGVLAGYSIRDVRRAIQNGQPQMTIADLLGSPLPADLVAAKSLDQIGIAWRKWLSHAGQDHRRIQPHPDPHPVGAADADGRQLRRAVRPDVRVPGGGVVPDRQRRRRRRHVPGHRGAARPHRHRRQGAALQHALPRRPAGPRRGGHPARRRSSRRRSSSARRSGDRMHREILARQRAAGRSCGGWSSSPASSSSATRRRRSSSTRPRTRSSWPASTGRSSRAQETGKDKLKDLGARRATACRSAA